MLSLLLSLSAGFLRLMGAIRCLPLHNACSFVQDGDWGVDLGMARRSSANRFLRALDFVLLLFRAGLVTVVCENTYKYAWTHILEKPTYSERDGSWKNVSPDEMMKFIGLLIYMGIV